ncbi:cilia- and flagella-associated protein 251-like [Cynara cardunculus var. scolymus]|uniref:cilia- and flagella-associated protein 251-like n=1 Tax=Cynara cardunculus var. scolymus TaxID=59895 RepID=UPI000D63070F|nr:cilia- and flagella-associated protein 251-like [Cynara cardunculus var. scolymus]
MLTHYRPTVNKEGNATKRPIPKKLYAYMKTKKISRAYRPTCEALELVPRTPVCIGIAEEEERTEDTLRPQAEEEVVRVEREREEQRKREEAKKKKIERERKKRAEAEQAEQERLAELARKQEEAERAEKAQQDEIARLREKARCRVEEEAHQSSSSNHDDDQEYFDDAARSYNSSEESEEEKEEEIESEEEESEEEKKGGGAAATLPQDEPEQPRVNKHIHFDTPTPSANKSFDYGGRDTKVIETEVTQPTYVTREEFHSLVTSVRCSLEELKLILARAEPSPSAPALDEIRASLAVLRAESSTNAFRLDTLMELTAHNAEALKEVITSMKRGEVSTSQDAQAIIPLNVPVDHVTQSAMNALGDRLL